MARNDSQVTRPTGRSGIRFAPAGVVITVRGRPFAVMGFTVRGDRIVEIDAIADPHRVGRIATAVLHN